MTRTIIPILLVILASVVIAQQPARRVRVRTRPVQRVLEAEDRVEQPNVEYYAVQPQEEAEPEQVVVVQPRQRDFGHQIARESATPRPLGRAIGQQAPAPRTKPHERPPPVQTIRNYNTINDDGSFTFGYEAADGSFKEETRGTDCVVRGKYGYVDPEGNKREFTYVSGNPCDPNNPDPEEDEREVDEDDSEENVPVRPNIRPNIARRPANPAPRRPVQQNTVFQNNFIGDRVQPRPTAAPVLRTHLEPTTFRPEIQNYPVAPIVTTTRPVAKTVPQQSFYTVAAAPRPTPTSGFVDFDAELKRFQLEAGAPVLKTAPKASAPVVHNAIHASQHIRPTPPATVRIAPTTPSAPVGGVNQYYSSQLVYDPSSGQYNTVLYQNLPKGQGDFTLNTRLQSFVQPPQHNVYINPTQAPAPAPVQYASIAPAPTPASTAQFGPQTFTPRQQVPERSPSQSFYYINPALRNQFSTGQIDAFLRGHNVQF